MTWVFGCLHQRRPARPHSDDRAARHACLRVIQIGRAGRVETLRRERLRSQCCFRPQHLRPRAEWSADHLTFLRQVAGELPVVGGVPLHMRSANFGSSESECGILLDPDEAESRTQGNNTTTAHGYSANWLRTLARHLSRCMGMDMGSVLGPSRRCGRSGAVRGPTAAPPILPPTACPESLPFRWWAPGCERLRW